LRTTVALPFSAPPCCSHAGHLPSAVPAYFFHRRFSSCMPFCPQDGRSSACLPALPATLLCLLWAFGRRTDGCAVSAWRTDLPFSCRLPDGWTDGPAVLPCCCLPVLPRYTGLRRLLLFSALPLRVLLLSSLGRWHFSQRDGWFAAGGISG